MSTQTTPIRTVCPEDAGALATIYNYYIARTVATFEVEEIDTTEMAARLADMNRRPWLVWEEEGLILGYAYASPWNTRAAYRQTVESTIYLREGFEGRGIGQRLYKALMDLLREQGMHVVIAGISLPNEASVALHERLGFTRAGTLREVGHKQDRWVDVGYWELFL